MLCIRRAAVFLELCLSKNNFLHGAIAFLTPQYEPSDACCRAQRDELLYRIGVKSFFWFRSLKKLASNGLGAFLGPNWKVFHHGTLRNHFQGVVVVFGGTSLYPLHQPHLVPMLQQTRSGFYNSNTASLSWACEEGEMKCFWISWFQVARKNAPYLRKWLLPKEGHR